MCIASQVKRPDISGVEPAVDCKNARLVAYSELP